MKKISLYIHIPFCAQKCFYCDFPSYSGKDKFKEAYIKSLSSELIKLHNSLGNYNIETIFIGGGTPSVLSEKELESLLKEVNKLNLSNNIEFSIECNPGSLTGEKLEVMKRLGINRISMGLQAVQDGLLKALGRIHNFKLFKENFFLARKYGFDNINVDLMFGLPNQTLEDWNKTLLDITELEPEHISAYSLIIEEGTVFYNLYENNRLQLPSEDVERSMYDSTLSILREKGYHQYEISNYSKLNKECKHNLVYWNMKEWIGVGSSSSSFIDGKKIKNVDSIEEYIKRIENNEKPYEEVIKNSENDTMEEFMFMGLRKVSGIREEDFNRRFSKSIDDVYKNVIKKYVNEGLLIRDKGRIYLSKKGIELSNQVMMGFLMD